MCEWMGTRAWSLENVLLGDEEKAAVEEEAEVATATLGRAAADANRTWPWAYPRTRARRMATGTPFLRIRSLEFYDNGFSEIQYYKIPTR